MHRISYAELQNAGFPVNTIDPRNLQLFFKGEEMPIYVYGEEDGVFDNTDHIEFFGMRNDGSLDATMYSDPLNHTNPYEGLYTDRTYYLLTYTLDNSFGKRISTYDGLANTGTSVTYHEETAQINFQFSWAETRRLERVFAGGPLFPAFFQSISNQGGLLSDFDLQGKGFTDMYAGGNTYKEYAIPVNYYVDNVRVPRLNVKLTGRSNTRHNINILAGTQSGSLTQIGNLQFLNYENAELNHTFSFSTLPTGVDTFYVAYQINQSSPSVNEIISLSSIDLTYAQALQMGNERSKTFHIKQENEAFREVIIEGFSSDMRVFNISDLSNLQLVQGNIGADNTFRASIPENGKDITLFVSNEANFAIREITATQVKPINLNNTQYIIISHNSLMRPAGDVNDAVAAYANYRASAEGGGYRVLTVDVENLYNQFTYGEVSPVAIRRFLQILTQRGNPEFLFFIGKGLSFNYNYEKNKPNSLQWGSQSLIPCYGHPCSDNEYTAGLDDTFLEPALATGRLPASNPQQVFNYLEKVKEHEAFKNDDLWKKNVLHLSGGRSVSEHRELSEHLNQLSAEPREAFGAKIQLKAKETTNTTEFIDISDEVNEGVGLMTFFGHSSLTLVDLEFGYVSHPIRGFNNKGKYPFLFMMGCNVGNIFTTSRSVGEDWVLTPEKGCIAFLAHTYLAFVDTQKRYSNKLYDYLFSNKENLSKPIGTLIKEATKIYIAENPNNKRDWSNAQQFVLSGDPAVKIYNFDKPDYHINTQSLTAENFDISSELDSQTDSFKIAINVKNFGLVSSDSFEIAVSRTFPDGTIKNYQPSVYAPVDYQDTLYFTIPVSEEDKIKGGGNNLFEVTLDAALQIDEMDEINNIATLELFLKPKRMIVISPTEYSIVNRQPVRLFAQSTEENIPQQSYTFQLDTSSYFNSPVLRDTTVTADQKPFWETSLLNDSPTDSIVYYWRVRPSMNTEESDWTESSFVYIKNGPNGWSQSHPQQFDDNINDNLIVNPNHGTWSFTENEITINASASGGSAPDPFDYSIFFNDFRVAAGGICATNNVITLAIDQHTGKMYQTGIADVYPHLRCGFGDKGEAYRLLDFDLRAYNFMNFYTSFIKEGDYVLLVSVGNVRYDNFSPENFAGFAEIGIDPEQLRNTLKTGDPYIAFGRKGAAIGTAQEFFPRYTALTPSNQQKISAEITLDLSTSSGMVTSPRIGPASNWSTFFQQVGNRDMADEQQKTDIIGVKIKGEESLILNDVDAAITDLSFINADTFPYLRLQMQLTDTLGKTPMQLKDWKVLYDEVPEGILFRNVPQALTENIKTLPEGDTIRYDYLYSNVSNTDFEQPLVVAYEILNNNTNAEITYYDTLSALPANDSIAFRFDLPTTSLVGENKLNVFVNPRVQAEQVYENNVLEETFRVTPDTINPVLDVLFDGLRIMDGDIVSATPLITILLKDENPFLTKNDTSGMEIFLSECDSCTYRKIALNSPEISYTNTDNNLFQMFYQPERLADGRYSLMVKAKDASGNDAGIEPYKIYFEVINEARITHFYPYPNPFSDRVRFVFTLTGSEIPSGIKIQIMTVSGKVVREITQDELGPIRVGNNMTEYAWDGRDEYGSQLANGVYLYRVFLQSNGEAFEHIETAGDNLFKNGFGKMYLMR